MVYKKDPLVTPVSLIAYIELSLIKLSHDAFKLTIFLACICFIKYISWNSALNTLEMQIAGIILVLIYKVSPNIISQIEWMCIKTLGENVKLLFKLYFPIVLVFSKNESFLSLKSSYIYKFPARGGKSPKTWCFRVLWNGGCSQQCLTITLVFPLHLNLTFQRHKRKQKAHNYASHPPALVYIFNPSPKYSIWLGFQHVSMIKKSKLSGAFNRPHN